MDDIETEMTNELLQTIKDQTDEVERLGKLINATVEDNLRLRAQIPDKEALEIVLLGADFYVRDNGSKTEARHIEAAITKVRETTPDT